MYVHMHVSIVIPIPSLLSSHSIRPSLLLGHPLGLREQVGAYKWVRHFEHATVTVDLNDPVGGSGVHFF